MAVVWFYVVVGAIALLAAWRFVYLPAVARQRAWLEMPTLEEYLRAHPEAATDRGPACRECRSLNIGEREWERSPNPLMVHACRACDTRLYRTRS